MAKEKKDKHFIQKPIYLGGPKGLKTFITKNLQYPKEALEAKVEGSVYVKYTINHKGKVIEVKVISSLGHGCDEEAVRLVKLLEFQVPKNRGLKVKFFKNIRINFNLPKAPVAPAIQYQYTTTPSTAQKAKPATNKKSGGSYNITINW